MTNKRTPFIPFFLVITLLLSQVVFADTAPPKKVSGFVEFNLYPYDTRDRTVLTINTFLKLLAGFNYFGFVNYSSPINTSSNEELDSFYTEQNLNWHLPSGLPFQVSAQWAIISGANNDILRFGMGWIVSATPIFKEIFNFLNVFYRVDAFPAQIDSLSGFNWQIQHVYVIHVLPKLLDKRVYMAGFADHDIGPSGSIFVTETQLGLRIVDQFYAVTEYRHDEFLEEENSVGFGGEYKVGF